MVSVSDIIDNAFIDRKKFVNLSKCGGKLRKAIEKERNEQADLLRKEVMTSIDGL